MLFGSRLKTTLVGRDEALPGREARPYPVPRLHAVLGTPLEGPWPEGTRSCISRMGCFWGAERVFWQLPGVVTTAVGYQGGFTPNPTYEEACTGRTGHTEAVLVVFDPERISLRGAAEGRSGSPTTRPRAMRQGNDVGTQYRSAVYCDDGRAEAGLRGARGRLPAAARRSSAYGQITTELAATDAGTFYYAEDYHQQYLHKIPNGYCGLGGTGISCPVGVVKSGQS